MIQLGGMFLVMAGAVVAPFVKKILGSAKLKELTDTKKTIDNDSESAEDKQLLNLGEDKSLTTTPEEATRSKYRFALTTGTLGVAVVAQTSVVWLFPMSYLLIGYFSLDIFKEAGDALFKEKKIKVDILDASVILLAVMFGQIAAAAFMVWILDLADMLLQKTTKKSQKYITDIFGEQPRFAWLLVDGAEVEVEVKDLKQGDIIVIGTGESIPVDGVIISGDAMIDQQSLTGESTPADKQKDEDVFASTVIVAGKIQIKVQNTGENTLASQVISIINEASNYNVKLQSTGEKIADKMVLPTMGLGIAGYVTTGSGALLAIMNADYGTGIRVAAPIALLASLGNAAKNGILIKHSEVIETIQNIDNNWVKVGSRRYIQREKIDIPEIIQAALKETDARGQSAILTAINGQVAGMIELKSTIREEAAEVIADLRGYGIKEIVLISGDHEAPTKELSRKLNIDRYFAGVLPNEKADYVKLLQDEGKKVMMVGDGINDSAALSHADIGVSLKGASTIATDVADVVFMDGNLTKFHYLFEVSENLQKNVKRSFMLIAIPKYSLYYRCFYGRVWACGILGA